MPFLVVLGGLTRFRESASCRFYVVLVDASFLILSNDFDFVCIGH